MRSESRAAPQVAGEQTESNVAQGHGGLQQDGHAGQEMHAARGHFGRKGGNVAVRHPAQIFRRGGKVEFREDLPDDPAVGASGIVDVLDRAGDAKTIEKSALQRAHARAVRVEQRAVDVSQSKSVFTALKRKRPAGVSGLRANLESLCCLP